MLFPSKSDFLKLAKQGNVVPVCQELLADTETPLTAYHKLTESSPKHSFVLESVEGGERLGRYSFIGLRPQLIISVSKDRLKITKNESTTETSAPKDPLRAVEEHFSQYQAVKVPGLPRFTGGMVGYIGCDYISCIEPVPFPPQNDLQLPLLYFMLMDTLVIFDRVRQVIQIVVNVFTDRGDSSKLYDQALEKIEEIKKLLSKPTKAPVLDLPSEVDPLEFKSNLAKDEYLHMIKHVKEYIKAGDIFQCVPSQRFSCPTQASPLEIYRALRTVNPSPYMFLMRLEGFDIIGSSPEIHVRCEDGIAEIRPIAGTRARGQTPEEDIRLEKDLLADEKERAEHLMLVDLARNDLGRVCSFKTVNVSQFMTIERYSHVMHIVSQVTGKILPEKNPFDLMRATFPAGTLSGAPKIRAMQIISELEKRSRGVYGGALGYFSFNGNLDTCITIRTLVLKDGIAYVQAGGGVVDDSTPEGEYTETVNKAKASVKAVSLANSFTGIPRV